MQPKTVTHATWIAFSAALAAAMMDLLDATVASVAGPVMQTELGGSYTDLQWITAAYTLAMAIGLLTGGRLGDLFGRKRMLLIGAGGFTLASLLCAAAPRAEFLIGSRALQGTLGAVMLPQVFGLIRDLFPPDELGPIVAGLLIDLDLFGSGWRSIFLINVPVGAYVLVVGAKRLPAGAPAERSRRLDVAGMALAGVGAVMLVYPMVQGRELGWPVWSVVMLGARPGRLRAPPVAPQSLRRGDADRAEHLPQPLVRVRRGVRDGLPRRHGRPDAGADRAAAVRARLLADRGEPDLGAVRARRLRRLRRRRHDDGEAGTEGPARRSGRSRPAEWSRCSWCSSRPAPASATSTSPRRC